MIGRQDTPLGPFLARIREVQRTGQGFDAVGWGLHDEDVVTADLDASRAAGLACAATDQADDFGAGFGDDTVV